MFSLVLPAAGDDAGRACARFADRLFPALRRFGAKVSVFLYNEREITLMSPLRKNVLPIARHLGDRTVMISKPDDFRSFLAQQISHEEVEAKDKEKKTGIEVPQEEWMASYLCGEVGAKKNPGPLCGGPAARVACILTGLVPKNVPHHVLLVGGCSSDDLLLVKAGADRARNVTFSGIQVSSDEEVDSWEPTIALSRGGYWHCAHDEGMGQCLGEFFDRWGTSRIVSASPPPGHQRSAANGSLFVPLADGASPEDSAVTFHPALSGEGDFRSQVLHSGDYVRSSVVAHRRARCRKCPLGTDPFFGLPLCQGRNQRVVIWEGWSEREEEVICGSEEIEVSPECGIVNKIDDREVVPLFWDVEQAVNVFECETILRRLASLVGQEEWRDPLLALRVYLPLIQRHLMWKVHADARYCGDDALDALVRSAIVATPENNLRHMFYVGFHPKARKRSSADLSRQSQCWAGIALLACCFRSVSLLTKEISAARNRFMQNHTKELLRARKLSRREDVDVSPGEEVGVAARKMRDRLLRVGIRKDLAACRSAIVRARQKEERKKVKKRERDPTTREEEVIHEKQDEAEVARILKNVIEDGFMGIDIRLDMKLLRASKGWTWPRDEVVRRVEKYCQLSGQIGGLGGKMAKSLSELVRSKGRDFDRVLLSTSTAV